MLSKFLKNFNQEPIEKQMERENCLEIPDGTYKVKLIDAYHGEKGGYEFFMFTLEVADGEYKGMRENIFTPLEQTTKAGKPMPEFVTERSLYHIRAIGYCVGLTVGLEHLAKETTTEIYEALREAFMDYKGANLELTIYTTPNKNNPQYPYRNYRINKLNELVEKSATNPFEAELELPF